MNSMVAFSNPLTSSGEMKLLQDAFLVFFFSLLLQVRKRVLRTDLDMVILKSRTLIDKHGVSTIWS